MSCLTLTLTGAHELGGAAGIWGFMAFVHERAVLDTGESPNFKLEARSIMC